MMKWLRKVLSRSSACNCDGCTGRKANQSRSASVSHGLHMWVQDGKVHWRAKSRLVGGGAQ